ncbi:MAG: Aspartate/glutamate/uridylate kinase family protein [Parcubacteria group bacterium GW2011_GWA1_48_11b]|uniref:Uridylate kinase n=3 Tax=Parcubacteria group TaxID=1794811 RepID=A0A1G2H5A6_9BACT|nr:MAG: Aspartate/glutamate/uridylate kinase family protein [Parcubacteria group bacterium GW2011_GWA2_47_10b]KKU76707.1 MAG: Aspartate/glutamate/uridylate kinase family protein [Candidatus Giovannonibacteria bacterium GW2011_GWB1_47_6b]KKU94432.1 MAG: Aspartate/glutamate/uridylate kinase family protein [Parcubacteria group bacterium GW2011_GWA1_48_11b]OGZ44278.1 MAG: hypothetical protein A2844_00100 [Candidatus Ryanbacteria bacterium RIFCSPHIGHO2_01_FULL_48_80]OGZ49716.1 MAG: hypothetical prot
MTHRSVILKLSGRAFGGGEKSPFDAPMIRGVASQIAEVRKTMPTLRISVVVGGGNIVRGRDLVPGGISNSAADFAGMLASAANAVCLQNVLANSFHVSAKLAMPFGLGEAGGQFVQPEAQNELDSGVIFVFGGGIGHPGFTTDTAAIYRARDVGAALVLKGTDVDGIYDRDPKEQEGELLPRVSYKDYLALDLGIMDKTAVTLAEQHGITIRVFNAFEPDNIARALKGEKIGSIISNNPA